MDRESLENQISDRVEETLNLLEEEWFQMNLPEPTRAQRQLAVYDGFKYLCDKLLYDERSIKENLLKRIENSKKEVCQLSQVMNLELSITCEEPKDLSLLELDKYLQNKLSELQKLREERLEDVKILKERDEMLCRNLDENTYPISTDVIPTQEYLYMLRKHIKEMEEEKRERLETYKTLRREILGFIEKLEKPLEGEVLFDIVCNNEEEVSLTKLHVLDIRKLHCDLEFETKEMESYAMELWEKISSLWNLLRISVEMKESFRSTVPFNNPSCIKKMEFHLSELKQMRLQNLGQFVEDLRMELEKWWERCFVSENQKHNFAALNSDAVTEELLEKYESEVLKWKEFYSKHSHIFEKIDYFLGLFDNMQQLEEKAKDPSRLFNTRGGALLQEEKERKRVRQVLPNVQEQLINICLKYEEENKCPFLIDGNTIHDYLEKLWKYHDIQREKEKIERMQNKKLQNSKNIKSARKVLTPSKGSRKRGREGDENDGMSSAKKLLKVPTMIRSPAKGQQPLISGSSSLPRTKSLRERNCPSLTPFGQPSKDDHFGLEASMSYDNFKAALKESKEVIHSSVIISSETPKYNERYLKKSPLSCSEFNRDEHQPDAERESFLKGTLNLLSPIKKYKQPGKCPTSRRCSVVGGASGGAFLTRSRSQSSLTTTLFKTYGKSDFKKWLY